MLKERASALQEQEVKLGAMLAALQMEKAKEVSLMKNVSLFQRPYIIETMHSYNYLCNAYLGCTYPC